jgi:hypothetical protein
MSQFDVVFFTICGGPNREYVEREYNFLFGSMEHHAQMGRHVVLDNSPPEHAIRFQKLPKSVTWVYEPIYGHGKEVLRMISAVRRASSIARAMNADINVYTDCDEFWSLNSETGLWPTAAECLTEVPTLHVDIKGNHYYFDREWHRRAWSGRKGEVVFPMSDDPHFVGNREDHPIAFPVGELSLKRVAGHFHHHMKCFIGGGGYYDDGVPIKDPPVWPEPLRLWKEQGIPPMEKFR